MSPQVRIDESSFYIDALQEIKHKISTMTVVVYLSCQFSIDKIVEKVQPHDDDIVLLVAGPGDVRIHPDFQHLFGDREYKNFQNSLTCVLRLAPGSASPFMNIKVFGNGTLHATGCKRVSDLNDAVNKLLRRISLAETTPGEMLVRSHEEEQVSVQCKTATVNIDFKFRFRINLQRLDDLLRANGSKSDYDQKRHQGINVQFCGEDGVKQATIIVFCSGSTKIAGSDPRNIYRAYSFIKNFVGRHRESVENELGLIDQIIREERL